MFERETPRRELWMDGWIKLYFELHSGYSTMQYRGRPLPLQHPTKSVELYGMIHSCKMPQWFARGERDSAGNKDGNINVNISSKQ